MAREDAVKGIVGHAALELERARSATKPLAGCLRSAEVVVLGARRQRARRRDRSGGLVEVVLRLSSRELADGDHRQPKPPTRRCGQPHSPSATVCWSFLVLRL